MILQALSILIFVSFSEAAVIRGPELQIFCPDHPNQYAVNCPYHQQPIVSSPYYQQFIDYPQRRQHANCPHHHHHQQQQNFICPHHQQRQGMMCPHHHQQQQQPIMYPQYQQLQNVFYPQFQQQDAIICQHVQVPNIMCPFHQAQQIAYETVPDGIEINYDDINGEVEEIPAYVVEVADDGNEVKNEGKQSDQDSGVEVILLENPEENDMQYPEKNDAEIMDKQKDAKADQNKDSVQVMIYEKPKNSEFHEPIREAKIQPYDP